MVQDIIPCLYEGLSRWLLVLCPVSWLLRSSSPSSRSNQDVKTSFELVLLSWSASRDCCLICFANVVGGEELVRTFKMCSAIDNLLKSCGFCNGFKYFFFLKRATSKRFLSFPFLFSFNLGKMEGRGGCLGIQTDELRTLPTKQSLNSKCKVA